MNKGEFTCIGLRLDNRGSSVTRWPECSWPAEGLVAGEYTIDVTQGGKSLGARTFAIVEMPGWGKTKVLAVDPVSRTRQAYFHDQGLVTWVPVDARRTARFVTVSFFHDGKFVSADTGLARATWLGESGQPPLQVQPVIVRRPRQEDFPLGTWTVVAIYDSGAVVGSWGWTAKRLDADTVVSSEIEYRTPDYGEEAMKGVIAPVDAPPDVIERAVREARAPLDKLGAQRVRIGGDHALFYGVPETSLCAAVTSAEALKTANDIRQVKETLGDVGFTLDGAVDVATSDLATSAQKGNAQRTIRASVSGIGQGEKVLRDLRAKLAAQTRVFRAGCMRTVYPASFGPLAPLLEGATPKPTAGRD
jgi:hypothetical protein